MGVQSGIIRGTIYCSTGHFRTGACLVLRYLSARVLRVLMRPDSRLVFPFPRPFFPCPDLHVIVQSVTGFWDSLWLVFPSMIVWRLGVDIAASLSVASQSALKAASGKLQ